MFGVYIFIAQYLQGVLELPPFRAGMATVPWALAFVAGSLSAQAASAALATLGGAVTAVNALPAPVGDALLTASWAAFGDALHLTAVLGASVLLSASVMSARILRAANPERAALHAVAQA
jgi:MFS transporter, DHA2 family, multidrug resistance protein